MAQEKVFKETKLGKILEIPGLEPLFLASPETNDPGMHAYVETLFWTHSFKDHSEIMNVLIPDFPESTKFKSLAKEHSEIFKELHERTKTVEPEDGNLLEILDELERHGKMTRDSLIEMITSQEAGEIKTLLWPSFMDHLRRESEYFLDRKEMLSKKELTYKKSEIIPFWTEIMAEHTLFTAHLLDPEEIDPIDQMTEANFKLYEDLDAYEKDDSTERLSGDLDGLIKLKTALLDGVVTGEVGSILLPELAEHMRHEALYFRDILVRSE